MSGWWWGPLAIGAVGSPLLWRCARMLRGEAMAVAAAADELDRVRAAIAAQGIDPT